MKTGKELRIKKLHLKFAEERGNDKTYCPSEIARVFAPTEWRDHMDLVRIVADSLVDAGRLVTLQEGKIIQDKPSLAKGPIRLRRKS